jgi:2,3,4,5-tetrahydropyridine-2-carboxylate N-succinyltransferase
MTRSRSLAGAPTPPVFGVGVPPGVVRYAFPEPGAIVMPGYVNIGAPVGARPGHLGHVVGSQAGRGATTLSGGV